MVTVPFHPRQVGERVAAEVIGDRPVESLPQGQRPAVFRVFALLPGLEAGDGGQRALGQRQDLEGRIAGRGPCQTVAAALAAHGVEQLRLAQHGQNAFQILFGDPLPRRDGLQRDIALLRMLSQIDHYAQGVAALAGNHHRAVPPFLITYYTTRLEVYQAETCNLQGFLFVL